MTRLDDMLERYGEACTKVKAAHILGRCTSTIKDMVADGRIREACGGTMIDVRSLAEYLEAPTQIDSAARLARRRNREGINCRFSV